MKKRLISLLLTAAMLVSMAVVPAGAAAAPTVSVDSVSGMPGETVTVGISVDGMQAASILEFDVAYDSDSLELIPYTDPSNGIVSSATNSGLFTGSMFSAGEKDDVISIAFVSMMPMTANGVIATMQFKIKADAADSELIVSGISVKGSDFVTDLSSSFSGVNGLVDVILPVEPDADEASQSSATTVSFSGGWSCSADVVVEAYGIEYGYAEDALNNTTAFATDVEVEAGSTVYYRAYAVVAGVTYYSEIQSYVMEKPVADEIEISGPDTIAVPTESTVYTAVVYDQFGDELDATVAWSLAAAYEGVSVDADNGKVIVDVTAQSGTATLVAKADGFTATKKITIDREAATVAFIEVSGPNTIAVPTVAEGGVASIEFEVVVKDQFGVVIPDAAVEWGMKITPGVDLEPGKIVVTSEAAAGTLVVTAASGDVIVEYPVTITKADSFATSVAVEGPTSGEIAAAGDAATTYQFTAQVVDQFGAPLTGSIDWSVDTKGVSIDANGLLTVEPAIPSCTVTVTGESGSVSGTAQIGLTRAGVKATSLTIEGADSLILPAQDEEPATIQFTADVFDQFGDKMHGADVKWSVSSDDEDAIFISDDGVLTVTEYAYEVESVTVAAACGDAVNTKEVAIVIADSVPAGVSLLIDEITMTIPTTDEPNVEHFVAVVFDQYGFGMDDLTITYSMDGDEYVSADAEGNVTVKQGATPGSKYVLKAAYGELTSTLTITLVDIDVVWDFSVADSLEYGDTWADIITLGKDGSASLDGETVDGTFYIVDADSVPDAGWQDYTLQFISDDGVYVVSTTDSVKIAPKTVYAKWTGNSGLVYDREPVDVTASISGVLKGDEVNVTVKGGSETNAGTYTAVATLDNSNYTLANGELEYTIAKAPLDVYVPDQQIKAGKSSAELAAQIGSVDMELYDDEINGTVTISADISGYKASEKPVKIAAVYTHDNPNYVNDVATSVLVTFVDGDPQELAYESVFATYGDAPIANPVTVVKGGNGAVTYTCDDESVATVDANGTVTIVGAGAAVITATVAGEGDWMTSSESALVVVDTKLLTVTNATPIDMIYNATNCTKYTGTAELVGVLEGDDIALDFSNAEAQFDGIFVGEYGVNVADAELIGEDAANYFFDVIETTGRILKADPTISLSKLTQRPNKVTGVVATLNPESTDATVIVEYLVDDEWTTEIPQEKGNYSVRAYTEGDENLNPIAVEDAVTGTLKVKKAESKPASTPDKDEDEEKDEPIVTPDPTPADPTFSDVAEGDWYYDAVIKAVKSGLFSGVSEKQFAPDVKMNRAMMVTVLAAMEFGEEGAPEASAPFTDLDADWYKNAVAWAAANGVTSGASETEFAPNMDLTREQIAVFLYAYAKLKGVDVSVGENTNILSYVDALEISEYAVPAMQWACGAGLIDGTPEGALLPKAVATRAQVAVILTNFESLING